MSINKKPNLTKIGLPIALLDNYSVLFTEFTKASNVADNARFWVSEMKENYFSVYSSVDWDETPVITVIGYAK